MADKIIVEGDNLVVKTSDGTQIYPPTAPIDPPPATTEGDVQVGPTRTHKTLKAGIEAAGDGNVIVVDVATYTNDFSTVGKRLTIRGIVATDGERPKLRASQSPSNGKGILVTNGDITIENIEFSGCKVPDKNGAGIRYEGGNLVIKDCLFHDNQNGILANADPEGTITITGTEFDGNGAGDGYSHNIYVNQVEHLSMDGCYSHDAKVGHQIKSRAKETTIANSRIYDGAGDGSYSVDLPECGIAVIKNCTMQQAANAGNATMVAYGMEKGPQAGASLTVEGCTMVNDRAAGVTMVRNNTSVSAKVAKTSVWGIANNQVLSGPGTVTGTVQLPARPPLS